MKIKDLQQSAELIKRYEALEGEIKSIQRFAMKVKDKSLGLKLNLRYEKQNDDKVRFDEDGSIITTGQLYSPFSGLLGGYFPSQLKNNFKNKESYDTDISEVVCLEVLGVIVAHKEAERMYIIQQLKQAGFTIE